MKPPLPPQEYERLCALHHFAVLDTPAEPGFDELAELAARVCGVPTALVSLVDKERQWFKAMFGFGQRETHRDLSFCAFAILEKTVMVVPDTLQDARFVDHPLVVGEPFLRFYAGAPLLDRDGRALGTLAVIDYQPRQLEPAQVDMLAMLARQVVAQLELRWHLERDRMGRERAEEEAARIFDLSRDLICTMDLAGRLRRANPALAELLGLRPDELRGRTIFDFIHPDDVHPAAVELERLKNEGGSAACNNHWRARDGRWRWIEWRLVQPRGQESLYAIGRDLTEQRQLQEQTAAERTVLQRLAEGAALTDAMGPLLSVGTLRLPGAKAALLLLAGKGALRVIAAEGLSPAAVDALSRMVAADGAPGRALRQLAGRQVLPVDPGSPLEAEREFAALTGASCGWACPIHSNQPGPLGALVLYLPEKRDPAPDEAEGLERAAYIAGVAVERHELVRTLQRTRVALEAAQQRARMGSWELELTAGRGWWSAEMYRLFAVAPEAGPPPFGEWLTQVHAGDQPRFAQAHAAALASPRPASFIFRVGDDPLQARYFQAVVEAVPVPPGQEPTKLAGTVLEVTAWRRAEVRLREQERQKATLIENLPGFAYRCCNDAERTMEFLSAVFSQVTGCPVPDVLEGRLNYVALIHPADRERVREEVAQGLSESGRFTVEYRLVTPDQRERWVRDNGCGVNPAAQGFRNLEGFVQDITMRRLAADALQHSEQRLRTLIETARDIVLQVRPDTTIELLNPAFERITGWEREHWLGRKVIELVHPDDRARVGHVLARLTRGEKLGAFELRVQTQSGSPIIVEMSAGADIRDGRIVGIIGIARDLTARKQLEHQLHQAQRMESIGQLAGGVAHDFNNVLAVILMQAAIIEAEPEAGPVVRDGLEQIKLAAERAAGLTRQLLTFSRRQHMQLQPVDLGQVIENLSKMLRRLLGEHIELQLTAHGALPPVHADVGMVEQVIMNLVVNARDAMPRGGRVTIGIAVETMARLSEEGPGRPAGDEAVVVTVADTGEGIPPEILPRIFEPFFTTKEVGKGTGLGLSTVYGIVRQHGGTMEVRSEVGRGTAFRVVLPALRPKAGGDTPTPPDPVLTRGHETIFVVEDEVAVRSLVRMVLEQHGYTVIEAVSGRAALDLWERSRARVDLLLTDMIMPEGISGRELAERFLTDRPGLPVVYTSGYSADAVAQGLPLVEGVNYLQKPYGPLKLLTVVRSALAAPARADLDTPGG